MQESPIRPTPGARSLIVRTIASHAPVSRANLARITDLSKQTVSDVVARLTSEGWVRPVGQSAGHVGRRAATYELCPGAALLASADLGGTKLHVRISDLSGSSLAETRVATTQEGGPALIKQVANCLDDTIRGASLDPEALLVLCIGVPGVPDPVTGQILLAPNIAGLDGFDFIGELRTRLGITILVENDVNLAAIGENRSDETSNPLVYLSIGTGIGAGIVCGGNILRGAHGAAGEVAFLPFGADPFEPESLRSGALERAAASHALSKLDFRLSGQIRDVPAIFDAAEAGEANAHAAIEALARQIARGVAALIAVLDPGRVVLGGSIGARAILRDGIARHLAACSPRPISICASDHGQQAPLLGGQALALNHFYTSGLVAAPPPLRKQSPRHTESSE